MTREERVMRKVGDPQLPLRLLAALAALTAFNLAFNLVAHASGWGWPYSSFLYDPVDRFADWFKYIASYPGGDWAWAGYEPAPANFDPQRVTNKHVMPITALSALLALRAHAFVPLWAQLLLIDLALLLWWSALVRPFAQGKRDWAAWVALGVLAYPTLLMLDRGNHMAGIAGLALVSSMALALRSRAPLAAGLLLALACTIRPNALLFGLPLVLLFEGHARWRALVALGLGIVAITVPSYWAANALYPDYSLGSLMQGLRNYHLKYVYEEMGLGYGSSLFGAVKIFFGWQPWLERTCLLLAIAMLLGAGLFFTRRRLSPAMLIFATCSAYALGSSVFADYHLMAFLAVPLAFSLERGDARMRLIALLGTLIVLAPKNYLFLKGAISLQVALNPFYLLVAFASVLVRAARLPTSEANQHQRETTLWTRLPTAGSTGAPSPASAMPTMAG